MFRLELPKGIRIYLVFYISLLELVLDNARIGPIHIDEETQEPLYEVNKIIGHKEALDGCHYLIYQQGYQYSKDTQELENYLTYDLIQDYHQGLIST